MPFVILVLIGLGSFLWVPSTVLTAIVVVALCGKQVAASMATLVVITVHLGPLAWIAAVIAGMCAWILG